MRRRYQRIGNPFKLQRNILINEIQNRMIHAKYNICQQKYTYKHTINTLQSNRISNTNFPFYPYHSRATGSRFGITSEARPGPFTRVTSPTLSNL